ncbi:peroxide stress protein YaaA [Chitinimonas koreensis]|uniref:peroxide stress protein YaaA n=1 Tax=Chitinimonas koreensis TaxID=356302 RepID=UPI00040D4E20|nr:peroxide stress protein YaaA [Chitinimonas koreensis]
MLFVLSPAKTLDYDTPPHVERHTRPAFVERSAELIEILKRKSPAEIGSLMSISEPLAALNVSRYQHWSPRFTAANSKQAVLAFMGDVYEGLDAASLDAATLDYAQEHLRILSGLYGVLRPLDRMQPYRLEMGTRLENPAGASLYAFWGDSITAALNAELARKRPPVLVNLASDEYFKAVKPKKLEARLVECAFEDWKGGRYKIISFFAKRARGLMARYALTRRIDTVDGLRGFDLEGYRLDESAGDENRLVFRRRLAD